MLTVDQALERILSFVPDLPAERVPLGSAVSRVLAEDVVAPIDVPPWDNTSMDGYAVRAEDGVATRTIVEVIAAGAWPTRQVGPGEAAAVMTGAPMPEGADAVVMVEDTDGSLEGAVSVRAAPRSGQHLRRRGESVQAGRRVLVAGADLHAGALALLASLGLDRVLVRCRPRVAVLSTGDEIVGPGQPLAPGKIYSSNNVALVALIQEAGGEPIDLGNVADDPDVIEAAVWRAVRSADLVLTTGGVSVGAFDHVKGVFERVGGGIDFWKVAMKPGKPLAVARAEVDGRQVPLLGLPGNPVSCMVNFLQFVRPWIRHALGARAPFLPEVDARLAAPLQEPGARVKLVRVVVWEDHGTHWCRPVAERQSSGAVSEMAVANGLAMLGPTVTHLDAGDVVRVQRVAPATEGRVDRTSWPR